MPEEVPPREARELVPGRRAAREGVGRSSWTSRASCPACPARSSTRSSTTRTGRRHGGEARADRAHVRHRRRAQRRSTRPASASRSGPTRARPGTAAARAPTIESSLASENGGTRVDIVTDLSLSGTVAQYGRGMIEDISSQMVTSFAQCLQAQLGDVRRGGGAGGRLAGEADLRALALLRQPWAPHPAPLRKEVVAVRTVGITVNGESHSAEVEPRQLLVYFLREQLGLTGTVVGCDTSSCGACTVLVGRRVGEVLHDARRPGRRARDHDDRGHRRARRPPPRAAGLPRAARPPVRLLHSRDGDGDHQPARGEPEPEREEIRHALEGNLCRCTGYSTSSRRSRPPRRPEGRGDGNHRGRDLHRQARPPQGGREAPHRPGQVHRRPDHARDGVGRRSSAAPTRTRGSRASTSPRPARPRASSLCFSGADLADDWAATLPCVWLVTEDTKQPTHRPLATDKVRYQGDGVAVVIAESRALAKDAAELVEVDYEQLPAVIDPEEALADGAPILHDDARHEPLLTRGSSRAASVDGRLRRRARHREGALPPAAADPERDRAARRRSRAYEPLTGEYTLWSATQIPHILRFWLAHRPRRARGAGSG